MLVPYEASMPHGGKRQYGGEPYFGVWSETDLRFIVVHKGKTYKVHQLVCEAFHGPKPSEKSVCMHNDEDSKNNQEGNLSWGTQKQNLNFVGYRQKTSRRIRKLEPHQAITIKSRFYLGEMQKDLAVEFGVSPQTISVIINHGRKCDLCSELL